MFQAADAVGVRWDDVVDLRKGQVLPMLFPGRSEHESIFVEPDLAWAHRELARVGVTMKLLYGEQTDQYSDAGSPAMRQSMKVSLFVACSPFRRCASAWLTVDVKQDHWLRAPLAMLEAFDGSVPRIACNTLGELRDRAPSGGEFIRSEGYREMAAHYLAAVPPGRVRKHKDQASVENTVWTVPVLVDTRR